MLGVVVGSILLIVMTNIFSSYASLSEGMFGLLLVAVLMLAPGGIVGTFVRFFENFKDRRTVRKPKRAANEIA